MIPTPEPAGDTVLAVDDRLKVLDARAPFADPDQEAGARTRISTLNSTRPPPAY